MTSRSCLQKEVEALSRLPRREALRVLLGLAAGTTAGAAPEGSPGLVRLGISDSVVNDVNIADARAAMIVWLRRLGQDVRLNVQHDPQVFEPPARLEERLRHGTVDTVALNIVEFRHMMGLLDSKWVTVPVKTPFLNYLLLVSRASGIQHLADLKGRRLLLPTGNIACIGPAWLATQLHKEGLGPPERFFAGISRETKASKLILSVLFGQAEACLTTSPSFRVMSELNPQVGKKLMPLAASPELVTSLYACRKGFSGPVREQIIRALAEVGTTPAGRQVLTLFQFEGLAFRDASCLAGSLGIIASAERLGVSVPMIPARTLPR